MFFFIREGKYVTAVNKFWFWVSVILGLVGIGMGCALLLRANQLILGIILGLLYLGCVVFDCLFLSKGKHSYGITACGYGIAAMLIPIILQCINLQSDSYIAMAAMGAPTIIANDIRELENMNPVSAEEGGDALLVNGNMIPVKFVLQKAEMLEQINNALMDAPPPDEQPEEQTNEQPEETPDEDGKEDDT